MSNPTSIRNSRLSIERTLSDREDFLVIGLTGRIGSGCSEVAKVLSSSIHDLKLPSIAPGARGLRDDLERDQRVLQQYAASHWAKFDIIQVRTVITTFLLKDIREFVRQFLCLKQKSDDISSEEITVTLNSLRERVIKLINEKTDDVPLEDCFADLNFFTPAQMDVWRKNCEQIISDVQLTDMGITGFSDLFRYLYTEKLFGLQYHERLDYLNTINRALERLSAKCAFVWCREYKREDFWQKLNHLNDSLGEIKKGETTFDHFLFVHDIMPALSLAVYELLRSIDSGTFTELYQKYGNCIRRFGKIVYDTAEIEDELASMPCRDSYSIPRKINHFIKTLRHPFGALYSRPVRITIDSIKNVSEATYLRNRYSAFYLFAISVDEPTRIRRLTQNTNKIMNIGQIHYIDWNEYPSLGREIYREYIKDPTGSTQKLTHEEIAFAERVHNSNSILCDPVRREAYMSDLHRFVLQDVESSIHNADVFISNNTDIGVGINPLIWEIVRNISLILYPGLLQPTPIERCMQIAFSAKVNSGCLSRQVGAVVTDADYGILSIGWNDVPCGDISCARKNLVDLSKRQDTGAYTKYELESKEFRSRIDSLAVDSVEVEQRLSGLPLRYCFKDIHSDSRNPMRSRAMHAEEKALAVCGNSCKDGYLFTTSSPCEMCSKNAKNHKIRKIYYIEPYPGISEAQYSSSGDPENIAEHVLFTGAIGRAYTQMYTPIMPYKDVLQLLGINDLIKNNYKKPSVNSISEIM